jgi:GLPGLI family protein
MKNNILLICFLLLLQLKTSWGQNLILSGKITYEKKENLHKQFTEMNSWTEQLIKTIPKYRTDQFELSFDSRKTFYKLTLEDESNAMSWGRIAAANNVWLNLNDTQYVAQKQVYEKSYKLEDSIPTYDWKYLSEFREIAGYNCRKAATILFDSVYVIAFYTEAIPVCGGPETFTGLPGMVLGVVIPRLHITWFATKVEPQLLPNNVFDIPKMKQKPMKLRDFNNELYKGLKDWGDYGQKVIWKANF